MIFVGEMEHRSYYQKNLYKKLVTFLYNAMVET